MKFLGIESNKTYVKTCILKTTQCRLMKKLKDLNKWR